MVEQEWSALKSAAELWTGIMSITKTVIQCLKTKVYLPSEGHFSKQRTVVNCLYQEKISICCIASLNYSSRSDTFLFNLLCHFLLAYSQQFGWKYNTVAPAYKRHSIHWMSWLERHLLWSKVKSNALCFNGIFMFYGQVARIGVMISFC